MNEYNDITINNDVVITNDIRYTNDDIPYNEKGVEKENTSAKEFGSTAPESDDGGSGGFRFRSDLDITRVAATFTIVAVVAMAVVLDDSPFGEFFEPITGIINEAFDINDEPGYMGEVSFEYLVTDTEIKYYIEFSQDPGSDVRLKVTNTFTNRDIDISEDTSGAVTGLAAGMKYSVGVYVSGEKVMSRNITTLTSYDEAPMFALVYAKCYCEVDDTFRFRFDVIDRNGVWSDFSAKLVYDNGQGTSEVYCNFTSEPTGEQIISTVDIPEDLREAKLVIQCIQKSGGSETTETLYDATVKI